jgi:hypothetical protein
VITLAEFCKCGSIILSDKCSNKNCAFKTDKGLTGTDSTKKTSAAKTKADKKTKTSTRRSSKCITYSIDDLEEREPKYKNNKDDDDYFDNEDEEREVDEYEEKYSEDEDDN